MVCSLKFKLIAALVVAFATGLATLPVASGQSQVPAPEARGFRACEKTGGWLPTRWTPASAGVTSLDLEARLQHVIPAKAGIHEFSHKFFIPAVPALSNLSAEMYLGARVGGAAATPFQSSSHTIQAPSPSSTLPVRIEPKAQQILDRTIQALGGAAFLNAQTLTTHGTLGSGGGGVVYFDSQVQFPDKRRLTYGLAKKGKPIVVINNGDLGWEIDRMGTVSLDSEDIRAWRFNNRYSLENLLRLRIHEPGTLVQAAGVDFVDNVAVNVLDMVDATQNQIKLYFATQTGLPVRISYRKWDALINDWDEYSDIFGNYGTYQGITIPRQISHMMNGRRLSEVFRSSAVFNETYPPGIFDDPTAPK